MAIRRLDITADSLDEARAMANGEVLDGESILKETVECVGGVDQATWSADTEDQALALAKVKLPPDAVILATEVVERPTTEVVEVQAATDKEARSLVVRLRPGKKVVKVRKARDQRGAWEGVVLLTHASVLVTWKRQARLAVTIGREDFQDLLDLFDATPPGATRDEAVRQFLLQRGVLHPERGERVLSCACGYPTGLAYGDHSRGPILDMVKAIFPFSGQSTLTVEEQYTMDYVCPKCGAFIKRVVS